MQINSDAIADLGQRARIWDIFKFLFSFPLRDFGSATEKMLKQVTLAARSKCMPICKMTLDQHSLAEATEGRVSSPGSAMWSKTGRKAAAEEMLGRI